MVQRVGLTEGAPVRPSLEKVVFGLFSDFGMPGHAAWFPLQHCEREPTVGDNCVDVVPDDSKEVGELTPPI